MLVASDIAARGLDVESISHVFNYDLPNVAETYVHRIGRTGRAGAVGQAVSFCSEEQRDDLREIERLLGKRIPVMQHNIKPSPPQSQSQSRNQSQRQPQQRPHASPRKPGAPMGDSPAGAARTGSPQQQKADFWHNRQHRGPQGWGKSKFRRQSVATAGSALPRPLERGAG